MTSSTHMTGTAEGHLVDMTINTTGRYVGPLQVSRARYFRQYAA